MSQFKAEKRKEVINHTKSTITSFILVWKKSFDLCTILAE